MREGFRRSRSGSAPARTAAGRTIGALGIALAGASLAAPGARAEQPAALAPAREAVTAALVADLRARVLAARSATRALEGWCAEHGLAPDPRLVARRVPGPDKPPGAERRARLGVGPDEPVRYRRVRLACGDRVLSEADNWYVPARLTPAMNAALDDTQAPFGRVVAPLDPQRRTVTARPPDPAARGTAAPGPDDPLFAVDAVLTTAAGEPFCEVAETYLGAALPDASR